jgi:hypothetical protein
MQQLERYLVAMDKNINVSAGLNASVTERMKVGAVVKAAAWLHQSARHFQTSSLSRAEKSFIASFFEKKVPNSQSQILRIIIKDFFY